LSGAEGGGGGYFGGVEERDVQFLQLGLREGGDVRWDADEELGAACYLAEVRRRRFVGRKGGLRG